LLAIITNGAHGRAHFAPTPEQREVALAIPELDVPEAPLPEKGLGFRIQEYGFTKWMDLFTPRQQLALDCFSRLVREVPRWALEDGADERYGSALCEALGLCVGKLATFSSSQSLWRLRAKAVAKAEKAFSRPALPMTVDFAETNPFGGGVGDWMQVVQTAVRSFASVVPEAPPATVTQRDARTAGQGVPGDLFVATDPPYFDQIGYADLSDFFYIWLRHGLAGIDPDLFSTIVTPKSAELISDPSRHAGDDEAAKRYFIEGFKQTFGNLRRHAARFPLLLVYAFKQQESGSAGQLSTGWEAMLEAVMQAGLTVTGTWPVHGTGSTRQRAIASNALATYVVLVCRQRADEAPLTTRREFQRELRSRLRPALGELQSASIAPVDLAQAAIGPGMAVFSQYAQVVEADGSAMSVRAALTTINHMLDETLSEQETEFDADTRWAVAWFEELGMAPGPFGRAETLSRAKNTSIDGLVQAGVLESRAGKVRLLSKDQISSTWDPRADQRLTVWELTQHLVRALELEGEADAGRLLRQVGGLGDAARDLAYRLYAICERKNWAVEGAGYNALVVAWPEISRLAASERMHEEQTRLEV
jgi:putative DNA methylase